MPKKNLATWLIIAIVIIIAGIVIYLQTRPNTNVSPELAQCIGKNSAMYSQTTCHYCRQQKDMFGDNVKYLNITECDYNISLCNSLGITETPTWIVNGTKYAGVQSVDELKRLTGC